MEVLILIGIFLGLGCFTIVVCLLNAYKEEIWSLIEFKEE